MCCKNKKKKRPTGIYCSFILHMIFISQSHEKLDYVIRRRGNDLDVVIIRIIVNCEA